MIQKNPYIIAGICSVVGAFGQIFFSKASKTLSLTLSGLILNKCLLLGGGLYALAMLGYVYALKFGQVSLIYPVIALSYVFVVIFASIMLNEPITPNKIIGSAGIVACVLVINY